MKTWSPNQEFEIERHIRTPQFSSYRAITSAESDVFSLHDTIVPTGTQLHLCYEGRREYVYILEGRGELRDVTTDATTTVGPGDSYVIYEGQRHKLYAIEQIRGICCFTPPTRGDEVHDEDGSYPL